MSNYVRDCHARGARRRVLGSHALLRVRNSHRNPGIPSGERFVASRAWQRDGAFVATTLLASRAWLGAQHRVSTTT